MSTSEDLKKIVRDKYSQIALQDKATNAASCCGSGTPSNKVYNIMMDWYAFFPRLSGFPQLRWRPTLPGNRSVKGRQKRP